MALDPSISLGVRPVQVPVDIPQPFQQLGQVLSLQGLMQQRQAGNLQLQQQMLQLQQAQRVAEEQKAIAALYGKWANAPQPAAAPPQQPAGGSLIGYDPSTGAVTGSGAPAAAAPQQAPVDWTGGFDPNEVMRIAPTLGPGIIKQHYDALESAYKAAHEHATSQRDVMDLAARQVQGFTDEQSKNAGVMNAVQNGWMTPEEGRQWMAIPYGDPRWQGFMNRALDSKEYFSNQIAQAAEARAKVEEARKANLYGPQYAEAVSKANQANLTTQGMQRNQDASTLAWALGQGTDKFNAALAGLPPERAALFVGAKTPLEVMQRAQSPNEYVTQAHQNLQTLLEAERIRLDRQKFDAEFGPGTAESWAAQVYAHPDSEKLIPPNLRSAVLNIFRSKYNLPLPTALEGQSLNQETSSKTTLDNITWIRNAIEDPEVASRIGDIMGNIGNAEQATGVAFGMSPQGAAKAQELRTRMRMLIASEAGSLRARISPAVMDALSTSSPRANMNVDMLKGALNGVEGNTMTTLDNLDRQRFGGQMRPRSARGIGGPPVPDEVSTALKGQKPGTYHLRIGPAGSAESYFELKPDGTIQAVSPPSK